MIDAILVRRAYRHPEAVDPHYKPSDAIISKNFIESGNHKLAVIFPSWHTHRFPINILAKRLAAKGWSVLYYDFHNQILEPDDATVVKSFEYIQNSVCRDLEELTRAKVYRQIHMIGLSLGSVALGMVCDKFRKFTSVTWVVGGDDLAVCMWHGSRTQDLRHKFQNVNIGIRKLAKDWDWLGPDHHLKCFKNKPVKQIISRHDIFIPTKYQFRLNKELAEQGAIVKAKKRWLGHGLTILRYCLFDNPV